jgi:hypothetical protein
MADRYTAALELLRDAEQAPETFARPFVDVLPVSGASVSTLGSLLGTETISASDDLAARIDELQFDLSEGPCWDALAAMRPVLEPALPDRAHRNWPSFAPAASEYGIRSVFAFPLVVGALPIGAVDLYSIPSLTLTDEQCRQAVAMSDIVGRHVLRRAIRVVHQATGVIIAQLGLTAEDARLVIHGHAFAASRPVKEIAREILSGTLTFANRDSGIEASG